MLQSQAKLLGLPHLTEPATWADYEAGFGKLLARARALGATHIIFGDIYPEANRIWAETVSARQGLTAVEPLWAESTEKLAREFLSTQSTAIITTVRDVHLDLVHNGSILLKKSLSEFRARCYRRVCSRQFGLEDQEARICVKPNRRLGTCRSASDTGRMEAAGS